MPLLGLSQSLSFTKKLAIFQPVLIRYDIPIEPNQQEQPHHILQLTDATVQFTKTGFNWHPKVENQSWYTPIRLHFKNCNPNPVITEHRLKNHHFTFGKIKHAYTGCSQITYHNLYPNIDWIIELSDDVNSGFKYTWKLKPGAQINDIIYLTNAEIVIAQSQKELSIHTFSDTLVDGHLFAFNHEGKQFNAHFVQSSNGVQIQVDNFNLQTDTLYIDPWVTRINSLTRLRNKDSVAPHNIGTNLDFDYQNNIYVYGGQSLSASSWDTTIRFSGFKVAKFDPTGNLKWVFSGDIALPSFSARYVDESLSNILVNKSTGKLLVGCNNILQEPAQLIRLDTNGMYDNLAYDTSYRLHAIDELQFNPNADNVIVFGNRANYQGDSIEINIKEIGKTSIDKTVTGRQFPSKKQVLCAAQD